MARKTQATHEFIYGKNPVIEALRGRREVFTLWLRGGRQGQTRDQELIQIAEGRSISLRETDQQHLDRMSKDGNHQGVVLEAGPFPYSDIDEIIRDGSRRPILVLDHLQDPQNLATLIRTAAAVDVAGVILQTDRSVSITPAVVRSSSGLVEQVRVAREANTRRAIDRLKEHHYWAVALETGPDSTSIYDTEIPEPAALIIGAEGKGVSRSAIKACDIVVHLPMPGRVDSLNAAIAGSVALFELARRGAKSSRQER